jgi:hypothetical protein
MVGCHIPNEMRSAELPSAQGFCQNSETILKPTRHKLLDPGREVE